MDQLQRRKYLLLMSFLFAAFILTTILVMSGSFLYLDHYIDQMLPYSTNNGLYYAAKFLANLYFPLLIVIAVLLWNFMRKKQIFEFLMLLVSFSGLAVVELLLKPVFRIPCPATYYANVVAGRELFRIPLLQKAALYETCYPSGHTAFYVVSFGYLIFLTYIFIKRTWLKRTIITLLTLVILLVGPSRVYLHVHWLSDVIAAYFLGFAILTLLIVLRKHYIKS